PRKTRARAASHSHFERANNKCARCRRDRSSSSTSRPTSATQPRQWSSVCWSRCCTPVRSDLDARSTLSPLCTIEFRCAVSFHLPSAEALALPERRSSLHLVPHEEQAHPCDAC